MILSKNKINKLDADSLVNDFIKNEQLNELLIIVPTNRKIRFLKRELISFSPNNSVSKINLHTFETFTKSIFIENEFVENNILSDSTAAVLLNKAFKETRLKYFSNYKNEIPRGTLERIKNVITEYKLNGIKPSQLLSEANKLESSEKLKAIDIADVYENYLFACKQLKLFEVGDIYQEVLSLSKEIFIERFQSSFKEVNTILINGFDEFTQPEIDIINLTAEINNLKLFVLFDYHKFNKSLFAHLDNCYNKFLNKGFSEIGDISNVKIKDYQTAIKETLFILDTQSKQKKSEVAITEIIAQNPEDEIVLIAKEIKNIIINKKVDSANIVVGFNLISAHSNIIRDVFFKFGIPFNLTDRFSLSESQPTIALINFLEILENNFYYKNIFRALTGKWINVKEIELANLQRVASNLKIVSGYSNWIETIDRTIEEIKLSTDDDENRFLPLWVYEKSKKDIENIYKILKPFKSKNTINGFKNTLLELISELQISKSAINDQPELIEKNVKAVTVFIETLNELFNLLHLEYGDEREFNLSFYLSQIKTAIQFTRYNIKERHANGVLITSVNELRGLSFDYVFIGGMVDGEFPTRYQPEVFFSGSYKKDEQRHILEDRYHFYQTLCCVNKNLFLSHSLKDDKKEFTPSTFISDLKKLFIVSLKTNADYENLIYSKPEFLEKIANSESLLKQPTEFDVLFDFDSIKNDVEIDKLRNENPFFASVFTGYLSSEIDEIAKQKLLEQKSKQYSASQLEEYAKCPFQYFAKRILHLEIIEEPSEEIEALELGSIIHSILFDFYSKIKSKNIILAGCDDKTFNESLKLIFTIAEKKIDKLHLTSDLVFYEKEKILGIAGEIRNSILYKFLEEERKNLKGYVPEFFELEFGDFNKSDKPEIEEFLVNDVRVRGKIDRIDIDNSQNRFKVIDYKLGGKKPLSKDLQTGLSLQLPLYVYASKILIEVQLNKTLEPSSTIIYSLKLSKDEFGKKVVHLFGSKRNLTEEELIKSNEELIKFCNEFIPAYVDKISKGIFNLSTLEDREYKVCRFCDYKSICRIQELG